MGRLHSTTDGRIWLDDQRMLLIHAKCWHAGCWEIESCWGSTWPVGFMTRMGWSILPGE